MKTHFISSSGRIGFSLDDYVSHHVNVSNTTVPSIFIVTKSRPEGYKVDYVHREAGWQDVEDLKAFFMEPQRKENEAKEDRALAHQLTDWCQKWRKLIDFTDPSGQAWEELSRIFKDKL